VLFPGELFSGILHAPTLVAQYILKDVVLVAVGMVLASTWSGARIVAEPRSMRSTLRARAPRVIPERVRRAEDYRSYAETGAKGSGNPPRT